MPPKFLVIGHISSRIGLGTSARNFIRVLGCQGLTALALDVAPGGGDTSFESHCVSESELPRGAITISVLGLDEVVEMTLRRNAALRGQLLNVGFFWWELSHIPEAWAAALQVFDAHLSGSKFLHEILDRYVRPAPVVHALHPLQLSHIPEPARSRFGIPSDATAFLTTLDAAAEPTRKNPIAAIDAFLQGAVGRPDALLIVRVNTSITATRSAVLEEVHQRAQSDARIRLIEGSLPYAVVMQLMVSCDVLMSMHRSEGLGLPLLESMALGRPVIGTAWSGNLDFMNADNSFLVDYELTRVNALRWSYRLPSVRRHGRWAEPSVWSAAAAVRAVLDRPEERHRKGQRAAEDSRLYLAEAEQARFCKPLIELARAAEGPTRFDRALSTGAVLPAIERLELRQMLGPVGHALHGIRKSFDRHLGWRFGRSSPRGAGGRMG